MLDERHYCPGLEVNGDQGETVADSAGGPCEAGSSAMLFDDHDDRRQAAASEGG